MKKYLSIALLTGALMFSGCGNSDEFVFTNTNVVVAPVCVDDAYTTNQDTTLTVNAANGVLSNDTPNGGVVVAFDATSTANGTVNVNQTGAFTYTPANSFTGTDTFTYTVANSAGQRTCTVTITVVAVNGFFVDAVNGNDGTGSFNGGLPFQTIQAAVAAAPTNADIVVLPGSYTGTVNLKDGQRLLGSGSVLAQGATRPQLTGPVVLADGNTLDFLRIDGASGDAVDGNGQNAGTVTNCEFANTTNNGDGVGLEGSQGNWTVSNNSITNTSGFGVNAIAGGSNTLRVVCSNNDIVNSQGAIGLAAEEMSNYSASITDNTFTNSAGPGAALEAVCGDDASLCLDIERNTNDDEFRFSGLTGGSAVFQIEQRDLLTTPEPTGAGNTGSVNIITGAGFFTPEDVTDGACGF